MTPDQTLGDWFDAVREIRAGSNHPAAVAARDQLVQHLLTEIDGRLGKITAGNVNGTALGIAMMVGVIADAHCDDTPEYLHTCSRLMVEASLDLWERYGDVTWQK